MHARSSKRWSPMPWHAKQSARAKPRSWAGASWEFPRRAKGAGRCPGRGHPAPWPGSRPLDSQLWVLATTEERAGSFCGLQSLGSRQNRTTGRRCWGTDGPGCSSTGHYRGVDGPAHPVAMVLSPMELGRRSRGGGAVARAEWAGWVRCSPWAPSSRPTCLSASPWKPPSKRDVTFARRTRGQVRPAQKPPRRASTLPKVSVTGAARGAPAWTPHPYPSILVGGAHSPCAASCVASPWKPSSCVGWAERHGVCGARRGGVPEGARRATGVLCESLQLPPGRGPSRDQTCS